MKSTQVLLAIIGVTAVNAQSPFTLDSFSTVRVDTKPSDFVIVPEPIRDWDAIHSSLSFVSVVDAEGLGNKSNLHKKIRSSIKDMLDAVNLIKPSADADPDFNLGQWKSQVFLPEGSSINGKSLRFAENCGVPPYAYLTHAPIFTPNPVVQKEWVERTVVEMNYLIALRNAVDGSMRCLQSLTQSLVAYLEAQHEKYHPHAGDMYGALGEQR